MNLSDEEQIKIGIDLGGTKIEMIVLDESGAILRQQRISTPAGDYQATILAISGLVHEFEKGQQVMASVGIGMPGAISPASGKVKNSNSVCLNGQNFQKDIESALKRSVRIENDANCFTLSEATDGAAAGAKIVFGVILGTGVGGGLVINGALITGPNAIAGEWGHNPLPWPEGKELEEATVCYCGKTSCIETWLCGAGLSTTYQTISDQDCTPPEIVNLATLNDELAEQALESYFRRLAKSLASVINILDPDVIVLGGGLSNIRQIYSSVPELWNDYVFSDRVDTKLVAAKYGDASGVRGAAWLGSEMKIHNH